MRSRIDLASRDGGIRRTRIGATLAASVIIGHVKNRVADHCGKCGAEGAAVPPKLVRLHARRPWQHRLEDPEFRFCPTFGCDVVYFAANGRVLLTGDVRRPPAYKTGNEDDLLCYCFDVSGRDALDAPGPIPYVRERVGAGDCACDVLNPSGDCCLGSIGRWTRQPGR